MATHTELNRRLECVWKHASADDLFSLARDFPGLHDDELDLLGACVVWDPGRRSPHDARAVAIRQGHIRDHIGMLQSDSKVTQGNDDLCVTWTEMPDREAREGVERYLVRWLRPAVPFALPSGPLIAVNPPWPFDKLLRLPDHLNPTDIEQELHAYQARMGLPFYFPKWCMDALAGSQSGYIVYASNDFLGSQSPTFGSKHFRTRQGAENALQYTKEAAVVLAHVVEPAWANWRN